MSGATIISSNRTIEFILTPLPAWVKVKRAPHAKKPKERSPMESRKKKKKSQQDGGSSERGGVIIYSIIITLPKVSHDQWRLHC